MGQMKEFPPLETERLTLSAFQPADAEFVLRHFSDPDVCRYLYDAEPYASMEEAEGLILWYANADGQDHCRWVLRRNPGGQPIGTCGFHRLDRENNIAELGYDLSADHWGRGYMSEALHVALAHGFNALGLNRVHAFVAVENAKSCAILERLGFRCEGVFREKHLFRGKYYDHFCYSLLKREWEASTDQQG